MAEEPGKEEKFDLSPELESHISLDEAKVLALQHARDNREVYGRYSEVDLVFEVVVTSGFVQALFRLYSILRHRSPLI